jgi:hypothetical protein
MKSFFLSSSTSTSNFIFRLIILLARLASTSLLEQEFEIKVYVAICSKKVQERPTLLVAF